MYQLKMKFGINNEEKKMVGLGGLEPPTLRLSGVRSNHLSYKPPDIYKNRLYTPNNACQ